MSTTVEINGVSKPFLAGSLSWDESVKSPGTARCTFTDVLSGASAYVPTHGQTFEVKVSGNVKFGGEIKRISEKYFIEGTGTAVDVDVQSYSAYLDDCIVDFEIADGAYTEKSLITYLVSNHLGPDYGIVADAAMTNGATLPALQFHNVSARAVLDSLRVRSGRVYRLTAAKLLKQYSVGTESAIFNVTEADLLRGAAAAEVDPGGNYYNSVVVTGSFVGLESITGNGSLSQWGLSYDPALDSTGWIVSLGYVTEAGANYPLGLFGVDPLLWTFDPATSILHRSSALGNGVAVTFQYTVVRVEYEDAAEVAAHKRRKKTFEITDSVTADAAYDAAVALVRVGLAGDAKKVTVKTRQSLVSSASTEPVAPSQVLTLNIPTRNVASASYLIETVSVLIEEEEGASGLALVTLTCREGSEVGAEWQDLWKESSGGSATSSSVSIIGGGGGGGNISGGGTSGKIVKFVSADIIGDSLLSESGSTVTLVGTMAATTFSGSGASLTSLPAAQLTGTIAVATQDLITRTGTLVAGATGAGFTIALTTSTVTGNLPWVNLPSGVGTWTGAPNITGDFSIATNKFTVAAASGNTLVAGTLLVTGATIILDTVAAPAIIVTTTGSFASYARFTNLGGSAYFGIDNSSGSAFQFGAYGVGVYSDTNAGVTLSASAATGELHFKAGGTTEWMKLTTTGTLKQPSYASQTTGWAITNAGEADFRYLFVDEMHAKSFIADLEQALAGGQIITKSVAMLDADVTMVAAGSAVNLYIRDLPSAPNMAVFETGDTVVLRSFSRAAGSLTIADAVGLVSNLQQFSGYQVWLFTRLVGGSAGTMSAGTVVTKDSLVLDHGVSGNGYYEVNAIDGANAVNSPYAQVVTWVTAPVAANRTVRARYGNLKGITGAAEYGLIAGAYAATDGQYFRASNTTFELHGINLKMWDGTTNVITMARGGLWPDPYIAIGNPAPTPDGVFGATSPRVGIFLGWMSSHWSTARPAMSIYGDANNYFRWNLDGLCLTWKAANTTLDASGNLTAASATLSGAITATTGSITGAFSVGAALTIGSGGDIRSGASAFGTGTGYWIAYNGGTPQFRIGTTSGNRLSWDGTNLVIISASVSIGSTGISVSPGSSGADVSHSYSFTTSFSGTNLVGLFEQEPSSTVRYLSLMNITNQASSDTITELIASNASVTAEVSCKAIGGAATVMIRGTLLVDGNGDTMPNADNVYHCGVGTRRWVDVYAVNGAIQTCDEREKTDIQASPLGLSFLRALGSPYSYRWSDPRHGTKRRHGFMAASIYQALAGIEHGDLYLDDRGVPVGANLGAILLPPLVAATVSIADEVATLRARIARLEEGVGGSDGR